MARELAIATCDRYFDLTPDDRLLTRALADLGISVTVFDWRNCAHILSRRMPILIRSTWDYMESLAEFQSWLDRLEAGSVRVINSTDSIRWNIDKRYLRDLQSKNFNIVPTIFIETSQQCEEAINDLDDDRIYVVKPSVSAGAWGLVRSSGFELKLRSKEMVRKLEHSSLLIQDYDKEIERLGEWSFIYIGGTYSHAVVKRPALGDFRVQWAHGGTHASATPSKDLMMQVNAIAERTVADLAFARIDGIERSGVFYLMELELFEPYLFLDECPGSEQRLATYLSQILQP